MRKAIRITLSLVASLALFSTLTMAQPSGNNDGTDKNKEHHSRISKLAFWRHHKGTDKNANQAQATQAPSKQGQAKTAQTKPASSKQVVSKTDSKPEQHASKMSAVSTKKASTAKKTKPRPKAEDHKTASLKQ